MAKNPRQSEKLLRLQQIFLQETDEEHPITMHRIIERLASFGVIAERKSLYENIEVLNRCGCEILSERRGGQTYYYAADRTFELSELRLLADAVSSSRFITERKSNHLLEKLGSLCSIHQADQLKRRLHIASRIKNMNETILYAVDDLYRAMDENKALSFRYYDWRMAGTKMQKLPRHGGAEYRVSPWQLIWLEENYYLVAFEHEKGQIRHYRVDRMGDLHLLPDPRQGEAEFKERRVEDYLARVFGMFGGEPCAITLSFPERMLEVMVDRFGKEIRPEPLADGRLQIRAQVVPSPPFYGWLVSLGEEVVLEEPSELRQAFLAELKKISKQYKGDKNNG